MALIDSSLEINFDDRQFFFEKRINNAQCEIGLERSSNNNAAVCKFKVGINSLLAVEFLGIAFVKEHAMWFHDLATLATLWHVVFKVLYF